MGIFPVKQPNGLYALFSTFTDRYLEQNLTEQDLLTNSLLEDGLAHGEDIARRSIERANRSSSLWEDRLRVMARQHGQDDVYDEVVQLGTQPFEVPPDADRGQIWALVGILWVNASRVMPAEEVLAVEVYWPVSETVSCTGDYNMKFIRHNFMLRQSDAWLGAVHWKNPSDQQYLRERNQTFKVSANNGQIEGEGMVFYANLPKGVVEAFSQVPVGS
jgi:hypothetical protein